MPSKLATATASPIVRDYAQGAAQDAMSSIVIADFLAPRVEVATMIGRYKVYSQKNRFRLPDTRRASGAPATRIGFSASDSTYNLESHALDFPVDNLEQIEGDGLINVLQEGADMTSDVAALVHEKRVIDDALTAVGAGTDKTWSSGAFPIADVDAQILNVLKAAKMGSAMGIRLLFGANAWRIFKNQASVLSKFTTNMRGKGQQSSDFQMTEEGARDLFLTRPEIKVAYSVYDTAAEGVAESISFTLDTAVLIFAAKPKPTRLDPSFMKSFALRGQFMKPGSYETEDGRGEVAKFDWNVLPVVTNSAAVVRLNIAES